MEPVVHENAAAAKPAWPSSRSPQDRLSRRQPVHH